MIIVKKDQNPIGHIENVIPHWHVDVFHDAEYDQFDCLDDGHLVIRHDQGWYKFTIPFFPFKWTLCDDEMDMHPVMSQFVDKTRENFALDLLMVFHFMHGCVEGGFNDAEFIPKAISDDALEWFLGVLIEVFENWLAKYTGVEKYRSVNHG